MRILYFAELSVENPRWAGVVNKVKKQVVALADLGDDVSLVFFNPFEIIQYYELTNERKSFKETFSYRPKTFNKTYINKYKAFVKGFDVVRKIIQDNKIDTVYIRKVSPFPCTLDFFKWLRLRGIIILYEYPTYPYLKELLHAKAFKTITLEFFFNKKLERIVDHFFIITDDYNASKIKINNWTRFSNGFDVKSVTPRHAPLWERGKPLHCLALANVSYWHGFDRFIDGLRLYKKSPLSKEQEVVLHIVGDGAEIENLRILVDDFSLQESVCFHGAKSGSELDVYFENCHLGVASLGLHRKGLRGATELKVREYCSRGIPFICAHDDPDFHNAESFFKKFPANDDPITIETVLNFAEQVLLDQNHPENMRKYALEKLSWGEKMQVVHDYAHKVKKS